MSEEVLTPAVPDPHEAVTDLVNVPEQAVHAAARPTEAEARLTRLIPDRDSVRRRVFSSLTRDVVHGGEVQ